MVVVEGDNRRTTHDLVNMVRVLPATRHWGKRAAVLFWLALFIGYRWYTLANGLSSLELLNGLLDLLKQPLLGPLLFIGFYAVQPLIFFPSWLLTTAGGYLYGPLWGAVYTLTATNISAMAAYAVGRFLGNGLTPPTSSQGLFHRFADGMRQRSFETILVMRFLFLPYDLVSYLAGFLAIRFRPFIVATAIGSMAGTLAFVFVGASLEGDITARQASVDPWTLAISFGLLVVSLLLWRLVSRRVAR